MRIDTLADLYLSQVRDMHSCESQAVKALPKMAEASTNSDLRTAFEHHIEETKAQLERLETILSDLHETADGRCARRPGG